MAQWLIEDLRNKQADRAKALQALASLPDGETARGR